MSAAPLLEVRDLVTEIAADGVSWRPVDRVSFTVGEGEAVALVGESGCGKSMTALSLLRLVPDPPARIASGQVNFAGEDLLGLPAPRLRELRGHQLAMVFQEPLSALNPVLTVGDQVVEAVRAHRRLSRREARVRAMALLERVDLPAPAERLRAYPHQLSGGMRQRVMLAMALAGAPRLLIADEPTTALDPTLQGHILELLRQERRRTGMALLLITHDLGLVSAWCDRIVVLYAAQVVETATVDAFFAAPRHPYAAGLQRAARSLRVGCGDEPLEEIPGSVPDLRRPVAGCRFAARCSRVEADCRQGEPPLATLEPGRAVRCLHPLTEGEG